MINMKKTIGIIGFGNMGSAIAQRIKKDYEVWVFDKKDIKQTTSMFRINVAKSILEAAERSNGCVILAVKPQDVDSVLEEISSTKINSLISIAAGISISYIKKRLGGANVVRIMPNLPIKVGKGTICIAEDSLSPEDRLLFAVGSLDSLGRIFYIRENMMDAATAVAGSGPGFFFALVEGIPRKDWEQFAREVFALSLGNAALAVGFDTEIAQELAMETAIGSLTLLQQSALSPEALRMQVTSKGGTTEAGLEALEGKIENLTKAVRAALRRAEELSKKE